ncbi:retrovirus-related pol polyprotein from transposon TNT 1-94 [Tanacetum coccineum]
MQEELNQFYRNKVWTFVSLPYGKTAIGSKWVFRNKKDEHGITTKNKARLVAQGYSQEEGIDYDKTFAPVVRMEAIRIFLAFATYMNFKVYQIDAKSSFLNGKLKEEVYVKKHSGFESSEFPDYVCKVDKALYGIKQAPKAWYETLYTFLIQNKFTRGRIDNTLFIYKSKEDALLIQVMMGEITYFLGLQIKQDDKGISICQEQYTRNLLKKYEISDSSSVKTPMVPPNNLGLDLAGNPVNETSYRGMIGSLMYLTATRYLKGARKILGGKLVCCSAKKQHSMAMSSAKAKYVVAAGCCASILWMKSQLSDYDIHYKMVPIFCQHQDHILKGDIELHFIPTKYQLADIFTKPLDEPTFTRLKAEEFWCTVVATHPNLPADDSEVLPLKEYKIKFSVMNGKKPLTLDYKTFVESTRLDYAKGTYVSHPSPETVKAELAKIVENPIQLDKTPVLKTTFPVAWRILFTFVVQVLGGTTPQLSKLTNKSRKRYVSYPRFILCALGVLLGPDYTQDESFGSSPTILSNSNFSKDPSKVTPIELTDFMVAVNKREHSGPEAPGSLPQKRKKPKSKKTPSETKGSIKSYLDPDLEEKKPPDDMEPINPTVVDPSGAGAEYQVDETQSTRLRYQTLTENKGKAFSKVELDLETLPLTTHIDIQAYLLSKDELAEESDEEEVFAAGDDMEEDTQADEEEHQSPSPNKDKLEPSHFLETQVSDSDSSSLNLKRFDNTLPLTERQLVKYLRKVFRVLFHRINKEQLTHHEDDAVSYADLKASIEGYYEENIDHKEHSDKRDAVKDDLALNKKVIEATEAYTKNSSTLTELLSLVKNFDFQGLNFSVESLQTAALRQDEHLASWAKSSNSLAWNLGLRMTIGENDTQPDTKEPPSHTEGEHVAMEDDKVEEEPTREVALIESSSKPPITDPILEIPVPQREGKAIATDDQPDV